MQHTCSKDEFARNDGEAVEAMRPKVSSSLYYIFKMPRFLFACLLAGLLACSFPFVCYHDIQEPRVRWWPMLPGIMAPVKLAEEGEREKFCHVLGNVRIRNYLQRCEEQCPGLFGLSGDMDRLFGLCMHAD